MKIYTLAFFVLSYCCSLPVCLYAGDGSPPVTAGDTRDDPVGPVGVKVPFDSVVVTIQITASARELSDRLSAISEADSLLESNIAKKLQLHLPAGRTFSSVVSQGAPASSARERTVVVPITQISDVSSIMVTLSQLAEDLPWPRDVRVDVSDPEFALSDPEHFRPEILKTLRAYLDKLRDTIGGDAQFEITGLIEPVEVEKLSDKEAFVSIPTQITVKTK